MKTKRNDSKVFWITISEFNLSQVHKLQKVCENLCILKEFIPTSYISTNKLFHFLWIYIFISQIKMKSSWKSFVFSLERTRTGFILFLPRFKKWNTLKIILKIIEYFISNFSCDSPAKCQFILQKYLIDFFRSKILVFISTYLNNFSSVFVYLSNLCNNSYIFRENFLYLLLIFIILIKQLMQELYLFEQYHWESLKH